MKASASVRASCAGARNVLVVFSVAFALGACSILQGQQPVAPPPLTGAVIHPDIWPKLESGVKEDPAIQAKVAALLAQMSVEDKVGQIIQADIASVTPADVQKYHLGSVLDGGNSGPYGNDRALAPDWLKLADQFYAASMDVAPGHPAIPIIWGSDSVHGNSNIIGATIFPHNIGLGAMRDVALVREIGKITAIETRVVGQDWTFSPTIAVARDDRWGRTYESYSEDPTIVRQYAAAMVNGIQGTPGSPDFLTGPHLIATAKHFLGDGGTDKGRDQGDDLIGEEALRDIHSAGYQSAIAAGVQAVMVSFSSWQGEKMTGNRALLTDVLRGRFGFNGLVVTDWNAQGQVPGCTNEHCPQALNAGIDMFMAPDGWKGLYENTLKDVQSGAISMDRLNEAVARILTVKVRAGLFDEGKPSSRPYAGQWNELGSPAHRAVARQAVRESLVLLKNENAILPLSPKQTVLVAGDGADNIAKQCGGWTISWQGTGNTNADFPHGESIYAGIAEQVKAAGGKAILSVDGSFKGAKPDVAIVVFGENPYAEFMGDRDNLAFEAGDPVDLRLIQTLHDAGIPVVSVFLSGRPLYVTREINASDAFVAAWLPGTEGGGVADVLFRKADGSIDDDFRGRLAFSWPRGPNQTPLNVPGPDATASDWAAYNPLFAFGYGLDYVHPKNIGQLPEAPAGELVAANDTNYLTDGHAAAPFKMFLLNADMAAASADSANAAPGGALTIARADTHHQEDTLVATWTGGAQATLAVSGAPIDLSRQTSGDMALHIDLKVDKAPTGPVLLGAACGGTCLGTVDVTQLLAAAKPGQWTSLAVRLSCLAKGGAKMNLITAPFALSTASPLVLSLTDVKLAPGQGPPACPAAPQS